MTLARNYGGHPGFLRIFQSPFLLTVSNVRSIKMINTVDYTNVYVILLHKIITHTHKID